MRTQWCVFIKIGVIGQGYLKNTIRDGGSTALYTAYTDQTVYNIYTVQTDLHCENSRMYAYIYFFYLMYI